MPSGVGTLRRVRDGLGPLSHLPLIAMTTTAEPTLRSDPSESSAAALNESTVLRGNAAQRLGLIGRARSGGVTGPAVVALSGLLVAVGVALDLRGDPSLSWGVGVTYLLTAATAPVVVRFRSLLTTVALPPLTFVAAVAALARFGGLDKGSRALVLDVGTTLALSAPLLLAGFAMSVLVAVGRLIRHIHRLRQMRLSRPARDVRRGLPAAQAPAAAFMSRRSSGGKANSKLSSAERTSSTSV